MFLCVCTTIMNVPQVVNQFVQVIVIWLFVPMNQNPKPLSLTEEAFPKHTSMLMKDATSTFLSRRVQSAFLTSPLTFPEASAN